MIKGYNDVNIKFINGDEKIIPNILYIPRFVKNLFSTKYLNKACREIHMKVKTSMLINTFGQIVAICKLNLD